MTCIVGITDGRTVTIGGDSAGLAGRWVNIRCIVGAVTGFRI